MYARHYGRSVHKRSTIELLLRGKMGGGAGEREAGGGGAYTHPHRLLHSAQFTAHLEPQEKAFFGVVLKMRGGYPQIPTLFPDIPIHISDNQKVINSMGFLIRRRR